jgi:hypothetical protein
MAFTQQEADEMKRRLERGGTPQGIGMPPAVRPPRPKLPPIKKPVGMLPKRGIRNQNKTEAEFEKILETEGHQEIKFEGITLLIGPNCRYTPDFFSVKDGIGWFHEVKGGFYRDDAMAKFKSATAQFGMFRWVFAQKKKGKWHRTQY